MNVHQRAVPFSFLVHRFLRIRQPTNSILWSVVSGALVVALIGTSACGMESDINSAAGKAQKGDGGLSGGADARVDVSTGLGGAAGAPFVGEDAVSADADLVPKEASQEETIPNEDGCPGIPVSAIAGTCEKKSCCAELAACAQDPSCKTCLEAESSLCEGSAHWNRLQACRELHECMPQLTVAMVHASADLEPFRLCLKLKAESRWIDSRPLPSDPSAVMPHTNKIGVPPGGGLVLRHLEAFLGTTPVEVTPYLVDVGALSSTAHATQKCEQLLDHCDTIGPCLKSGEFHELPSVSLGVGTNGISLSVLVVQGCVPPNNGSKDALRCGSDGGSVDGLTVVALPTFKLEPAPPSDGSIRLFSTNLSPSAAPIYLSDAGAEAGLTLTYGALGGDAGETLLHSAGFSPTEKIPQALVEVPGTSPIDLSKFASTGFALFGSGPVTNPTPVLQLSLAAVQDLSDNKSLPHTFWNGSTDYLIALVGDATDASAPLIVDNAINPLFDGYGLHILALPLRARPASSDAGANSPDAL